MTDVYANSKLAFHKEKLNSFLDKKIIAPIYVRIKPTNKCNHRCFYCSYDKKVGGVLSEGFKIEDEISREKMLEILSDFKEMGVKAITFSGGGEPLIYPFITETLEKALEYGIDISIITNGQNLKGKTAEVLRNAKWVRISFGETNPSLFSKIRGISESSFFELIENIKNFAKEKNEDCELGINFAVHKDNADLIYQSAIMLKDLGVNHIKFTPIWTPNFFEYHSEIKEKVIKQINDVKRDLIEDGFNIYDTYQADFELSNAPEKRLSRCYVMQTIPVIGADSAVYFCHDKTYTNHGFLGSIKNRSFKDLWLSKGAEIIFNNFNPQRGCKHHCTYDPRNLSIQKMLDDMDNLERYKPKSEKHKNFI